MRTSPQGCSARVLVIDTDQHILLLADRGATPQRSSPVWITPGGGVDDGEDVRAAACRELFEEVGIRARSADLLGPLTVQDRPAVDGGRAGIRDIFYAVRTTPFEPDLSGLTPFERDVIVGFRWWRLAELETTCEPVLPRNLSGLFAAELRRVRPRPLQA